MNKKQILKLSGDILCLAFVIPSIVFWGLFGYAGFSLSGFFILIAFIMHSYELADAAARQVFESWVIYFYFCFIGFIGLITLFLSSWDGPAIEKQITMEE